MGPPLLSVSDVTVRYGATTALDGVDLTLMAGEVHALVGENGAGKSTLLRAVAGAVKPCAGTIRRRAGVLVAWVPQEADMPPDLSAGDWIFLGAELHGPMGWLRQRAMRSQAAAALRGVGCEVAPGERLGRLPATQRKQVQLARALRGSPDVLLLDEPTAVLGAAETQRLFAAVRDRSRGGTGVLYVSHRLEEVLAIADRVTVLRDGCRVSTDPVDAVDTAAIVRRMVGRDVATARRREAEPGDPVVRLRDVSVGCVQGVSCTVRRGEIVGLAGLVGAGRSELLEAIAGLRPLCAGSIECSCRFVLLPEDRVRKGLVPTLGLRENLMLPVDGWWVHATRERRTARAWIAKLGIRAPGVEAAIDALSGGNQQKLLLARALRHEPRLLLLDEPTAGVDVGAKAEIHRTIRQLADEGAAILLASSDLPELLVLCDRVVALYGGRAAGVLSAREATEARVAALITGAAGQGTEAGECELAETRTCTSDT